MQLQINGETREVGSIRTVAELIASLDLTPQHVAVELNETLVKRARFGETLLAPGDRVEVVTLVGGG